MPVAIPGFLFYIHSERVHEFAEQSFEKNLVDFLVARYKVPHTVYTMIYLLEYNLTVSWSAKAHHAYPSTAG
jgi:hypothetical protein